MRFTCFDSLSPDQRPLISESYFVDTDEMILISFFVSSLLTLSSASPLIKERVQALTAGLGACSCAVSALSREAGDGPLGVSPIKDLNGRSFDVTVMNDEFAVKLFQEMTAQGKIPFGYPEDGCYARAHEMALRLAKKGIHSGKVFAIGTFRVENEKAAKRSVTWGFHVAPFVAVDDGKSKQLWVIDPSLFYEPATLEDWLKSLTAHPKAQLKEVFLTNKYIYHPKHKNKTLNDFDPSDLESSTRIMDRYLKTDLKRTKRTLDGN